VKDSPAADLGGSGGYIYLRQLAWDPSNNAT